MDPDKVLHDINVLLYSIEFEKCLYPGVRTELDDLCLTLYNWLDNDGFVPKWDLCPLGTGYYVARAANFSYSEQSRTPDNWEF